MGSVFLLAKGELLKVFFGPLFDSPTILFSRISEKATMDQKFVCYLNCQRSYAIIKAEVVVLSSSSKQSPLATSIAVVFPGYNFRHLVLIQAEMSPRHCMI